MELTTAERETKFLEELRTILHNKTRQQLHPKEATFKRIYEELQPTLNELQNRYNIQYNPTGTNTEIIMFQSIIFSSWYNKHIFTKKKADPMEVLTIGLEQLFDNNNIYTYPDGRTICFRKGTYSIPNIKRDILREFDLLKHDVVMFKVKHLLNVVRHRFS